MSHGIGQSWRRAMAPQGRRGASARPAASVVPLPAPVAADAFPRARGGSPMLGGMNAERAAGFHRATRLPAICGVRRWN
jgi:hypothetical protein